MPDARPAGRRGRVQNLFRSRQVRAIHPDQPWQFREARAVRARKRLATFVYPALKFAQVLRLVKEIGA
ncbi:hypothetical protein SS05631_c01110 [Sinorhizobium sp. CCBAU 05631]|nr:hypothetical protein SS05631_c01110 [Sinorhizobium sp. CCBAU 05631]